MQPSNLNSRPDSSASSSSAPQKPQPSRTHRSKSNTYKREGFKSIVSTILIIAMAPVLAIFIVAFVFQSYQVDGPSMQPTLETNDRLIIWKVGRTWSRITGNTYMPERGSIIVFVKRGLYDFSSDRDKQLIKRVIGLPGDRVVVEDGVMTVYNNQNPDGFNPDETLGITDSIMGENTHNVDITVREDEVFVVGDHRDNSLDSRSFGTIPASDIIGTLSSRIMPLSEARKF